MEMKYLEFISKGLISGLLSAYLLIYGLRPAVPDPEIILEFFENKFLFLLLLVVNYYIFVWDYNSGTLLLLCVVSLIFDYIVFASNDTSLYDSKTIVNDQYKGELLQETFFTNTKEESKKTTDEETFEDKLIKGLKEKVSKFIFNEPAPYIA